jgi:hypothetical protein
MYVLYVYIYCALERYGCPGTLYRTGRLHIIHTVHTTIYMLYGISQVHTVQCTGTEQYIHVIPQFYTTEWKG